MLRLLFDQNISFRILKLIEDLFPESVQVRMLGLEDKSDIEIWNFARENDYSIVTFDADFSDIANLKGHPPKVIWLRIGNTSTESIANVFSERKSAITGFLIESEQCDFACLEIH